MFEPLLASLTWGYATRKPELGRISGAGRLAAKLAPEVMRPCSNPVGHRPLPADGAPGIERCSQRPAGQAHNHGFVAMTSSVSPGQSQKRPSGERSDKRPRRSASKSARRSPNNRGAAHDIEK